MTVLKFDGKLGAAAAAIVSGLRALLNNTPEEKGTSS